MLKNLGLAKYFDFVLTSEELGVEKPDVLMFDAALEAAGDISPDAAVHVGDSAASALCYMPCLEFPLLPSPCVSGNIVIGIVCWPSRCRDVLLQCRSKLFFGRFC